MTKESNETEEHTVVLGTYQIKAQHGFKYNLDSVLEMFAEDGDLRKDTLVYGRYVELYRPSINDDGINGVMSAYYERYMTIDPNRVCGLVTDLWIREVEDDPESVVIEGKVHPTGPYKEVLESALKDPNKEFRLRSRNLVDTDKDEDGAVEYRLKELITFDYVPGT